MTRRQKLLDGMIASVSRVQSVLSFLLKQNMICCLRSKIFELRHIFRRSITYVFVADRASLCVRTPATTPVVFMKQIFLGRLVISIGPNGTGSA